MLRITKQSDYGIVLLGQFVGLKSGDVLSAKESSSQTGIPLPMVSKILKGLSHEGLLDSQRGPTGGYQLARPADQIRLVEIIEAIEGPIAMTSCCGPEEAASCNIAENCRVRVNWQRINHKIHEALSDMSLADMTDQVPCHDDTKAR
ncbi:MAG: SUF system Fe-S cluster assembly regulator [Planctomycetota bacterium]